MLEHFTWDGMLLEAAVHRFCTCFYDFLQTLNRTIF